MTQIKPGVPYTAKNRLWDLIDDNSALLPALSRFGIPLGFGNSTVGEVCAKNNVHLPTFLAVANCLSGRSIKTDDISLLTLMEYLRGSHTYFLDFLLPSIRRKLVEAVTFGKSDTEVSVLLLKFFDSYVEEISNHMNYEDEAVFTYINRLLEGNAEHADVPEGLFTDRHDHVARKLNELKDIIVRYYPQRNSDIINSTLRDIINCEKEILEHCFIEDKLFEPAVKEIENHSTTSKKIVKGNEVSREETVADSLSSREKEIIKMVACGLSNKEIAEKLYISVHTVTTHRRNLSAKLDIHSPAALTIFAVMNHIVNLDDIRTLTSN